VQHPSFRSVIGRFIVQFLVSPVNGPSAIGLVRFPIVGPIPSARHHFHDRWPTESNTSALLIIFDVFLLSLYASPAKLELQRNKSSSTRSVTAAVANVWAFDENILEEISDRRSPMPKKARLVFLDANRGGRRCLDHSCPPQIAWFITKGYVPKSCPETAIFNHRLGDKKCN
jgi:hypothetical protein